jgi:PAS domain S-box-containing protein
LLRVGRIKKYINAFEKTFVGNPGQFSAANRSFNTVHFFILLLLGISIVFNLASGIVYTNTVLVGAFLLICCLYYLGRKKKSYAVATIVSVAANYVVLVDQYVRGAGINGPGLYVFFLIFQLLLSFTPRFTHKYWFGMHIVLPFFLLYAEELHPGWIQDIYHGNEHTRRVDLVFGYLMTLSVSYIISEFLRNNYRKEKKLAEHRALSLKVEKEKLQKSQAHKDALYESSPICHVLLDHQGRIVDYNSASRRFVREYYGVNMMLGETFSWYLSKDYQQQYKDHFNAAVKGERSRDEVYLSYDGKPAIWWIISLIPTISGDGEILGVSFNAENISDRKEKEQVIRAKNDILSKIAFIQSHEFRVPVANIQGLLELLEYDHFITDRAYFEHLRVAARQLDEKIVEVINLSSVLHELKQKEQVILVDDTPA